MSRKNFGITDTNGQALAIVGTFFHKSSIGTIFGINCLRVTSRISHCRRICRVAKSSDREEHEGCDGGQGQAFGFISCAGGFGAAFG